MSELIRKVCCELQRSPNKAAALTAVEQFLAVARTLTMPEWHAVPKADIELLVSEFSGKYPAAAFAAATEVLLPAAMREIEGAQARIDYGMQILHIFSTRRAARVAAEALAATDRTFVFPDEHDPVGYRSLEAATTVLSTCLIEQDDDEKLKACTKEVLEVDGALRTLMVMAKNDTTFQRGPAHLIDAISLVADPADPQEQSSSPLYKRLMKQITSCREAVLDLVAALWGAPPPPAPLTPPSATSSTDTYSWLIHLMSLVARKPEGVKALLTARSKPLARVAALLSDATIKPRLAGHCLMLLAEITGFDAAKGLRDLARACTPATLVNGLLDVSIRTVASEATSALLDVAGGISNAPHSRDAALNNDHRAMSRLVQLMQQEALERARVSILDVKGAPEKLVRVVEANVQRTVAAARRGSSGGAAGAAATHAPSNVGEFPASGMLAFSAMGMAATNEKGDNAWCEALTDAGAVGVFRDAFNAMGVGPGLERVTRDMLMLASVSQVVMWAGEKGTDHLSDAALDERNEVQGDAWEVLTCGLSAEDPEVKRTAAHHAKNLLSHQPIAFLELGSHEGALCRLARAASKDPKHPAADAAAQILFLLAGWTSQDAHVDFHLRPDAKRPKESAQASLEFIIEHSIEPEVRELAQGALQLLKGGPAPRRAAGQGGGGGSGSSAATGAGAVSAGAEGAAAGTSNGGGKGEDVAGTSAGGSAAGRACDHCGKRAGSAGAQRLQKCGACGKAHYCSAECQRAAWPKHKKECTFKKGKA